MTRRRPRASWPLIAIAGWGGLVACASKAGDGVNDGQPRRAAAAIQGGTSDTTSSFVVAVVDEADDICSGTLIAPNLVLTARHCVAEDSGSAYVDCDADEFTTTAAPASYRVSTASSADYATAPYGVSKILTPKDAKFCGDDIALLVLDQRVPANVAKPAEPVLDPATTAGSGTTTAIGYGATKPNGGDQGSRHRRDDIPVLCVPGDSSGCDPADFGMTARELAMGDGLCEGDSGSAPFIPSTLEAGTPKVLGVLSRPSASASECTDAIYTRTDAHASFLVESARAAAVAGGYVAPSWARSTTEADAGAPDAGASSPGEPSSDDPVPAVEQTQALSPSATSGSCSIGRSAAASRPLGGGAALATLPLVVRRRRRRS